MNTDREIIQQIEGLLTRETRVHLHEGEMAITSRNGDVNLSGTVEEVAAKRIATRLASQLRGVKRVRDDLLVTSPNPMGDLEIAEHVRNAFIQEQNIEEDHITLEVDPRGRVTLRGKVHSLIQYRLCEVLTWWVPGVTDVQNLLEVNPAEADNDEELKDNLITIMEKDVLVNPKKFQVETRGGIVTLRGRVDSPIEKDAAEKDCWYTPGVVEVVNELKVG